MFEVSRIKLFGNQPEAHITDKKLEQLIHRDFGNKTPQVKQKLLQVTSDTQNGKNRISATIVKLSNKDVNKIDYYVDISNSDFRDVILQAEYPRCSKLGFGDTERQNMKRTYLEDWTEYSKWLNK
jgi:hypothetical protein